MTNEHFLITGAMGCIGAWTVRNLVQAGIPTTVFDLSDNPGRMRLVMSEDEIAQVNFVQGDIVDLATVQKTVTDSGATHIVHLAGLQVPFCKANPSLGAQVNVVGTVNVFEAVRHSQGQVKGFAFAGSVAALGPPDFYDQTPIGDDALLWPNTLYGVYKQANEHTARLYWQDWQIGSVGLRPYIVYGVARDQGLTSDLAKAVLAVAAEQPYHINFGGLIGAHYADDVALTFIESARAGYQGTAVCNLRNDVIDVGDFVTALKAVAPGAQITYEADQPLPFPADLDDSGLRSILGKIPHTPLSQAIRQDLAMFQTLVAEDRIDLGQLER